MLLWKQGVRVFLFRLPAALLEIHKIQPWLTYLVFSICKVYMRHRTLPQNVDALEFASEDLQKDREIVMAALKQNGWALRFASLSPCLSGDPLMRT